MLRQVPSKAVVSTFIRSQCCSARWPRPSPRQALLFSNSSPAQTALMPKPPNAGRTSPSQLRAQPTSVPQVKLNAAFPRVVASLRIRLAYAINLTCVRYKLWPDSGNTTNTSRCLPHCARRARRPGGSQEQRVQNIGLPDGQLCRSAHGAAARWLSKRFAAGFLILLAFLAIPAAAQEGTVKGQHGDWQIVCKDPPARCQE